MKGKVSGHICSMAWKEVENRDSMKWLEYAATMNNGYEARDPTQKMKLACSAISNAPMVAQSTSSHLPELPGIRLPAWAVSVRAQIGRRGFRPNIPWESI